MIRMESAGGTVSKTAKWLIGILVAALVVYACIRFFTVQDRLTRAESDLEELRSEEIELKIENAALQYDIEHVADSGEAGSVPEE